jgi:hypothetical protein
MKKRKRMESAAELLSKTYEQHWAHARHVESERLSFTNIYFTIIVATLGSTYVIIQRDGVFSSYMLIPGIIILISSLCGFFMALTLRAPFVAHMEYAKKMLRNNNLSEYWAYGEYYSELKPRVTFHGIFLILFAFFAFVGTFISSCAIFPYFVQFISSHLVELSTITATKVTTILSTITAIIVVLYLFNEFRKSCKKEEAFKNKVNPKKERY